MSLQENSANGTPKGARIIFGVFMVLVYVGMGIASLCGAFNSFLPLGIAIALGCLFIIYGLWRGFRLYKGWN